MERPDLVPSGIDAGLRLELGVQLDPVHHHPRVADRVPELGDEARRVERGAARQFGAIDQQDVTPSELREVVGDAGPGDAATDDHDPGAIVLHFCWHVCWHVRRLAACSSHSSNRSSAIERESRSKCLSA